MVQRWSIGLAATVVAATTLAHAQSQRGAAQQPAASPSSQLAALVGEALTISTPDRTQAQYASAGASLHGVLTRLQQIPRTALELDDQVDYDLLDAEVKTRLFEIETVRLHEVNPASYISLRSTDVLFMRPGAMADDSVRDAVRELKHLPTILASGKANLKNPARVWTEDALYQIYYAKLLLQEYVPQTSVDDPALKQELLAARDVAFASLLDFEKWMQQDLLARSTRAPAWKPEEIEFVQSVHEQLDEYGVDAILRIAAEEEQTLTAEMSDLAKRIHPSGDLRTVWDVMKQEAPPWEGVIPMAQRYVDMFTAWLRGRGSHVVTIPAYIDYGARLATPMARRGLSFGGSQQGPTIAGRQSGYYVLTPLEDRLTPQEGASRIRSFNPYWTHVISYHEWLGHNVQIAARVANVRRPMRQAFRTGFSQSWSFYLEKLMEDEGYYETLPYMERLKTQMARRQMRMWRVQRILTKGRMAKGEMTFEQAVEAYVQKMGMEPTNAFIEVQRDSQTPRPPGSEIIGERALLQLRDEYRRRMGEHYRLKEFNDTLLTYGEIPFKQIRRLMFRGVPVDPGN